MTLTTINLAALGDTINLTTEVTGTLPIANGGTNSTATTFVNATSNVTGALPVANGGTALTSGFINGTLTPGKILQAVFTGSSTETSSSSTDWADTSLGCNITPSSASSKIIVIINQVGLLKNSSDNGGKLKLLRDAVDKEVFENDFGRNGGTGLNIVGSSGVTLIDTPNTTSLIHYKTQFACSVTAAASIAVQHNSAWSSITLMELGA